MAGKQSSFLSKNGERTHSQALDFTFDFEADFSNIDELLVGSSSNICSTILGDIEFAGKKKSSYLRYIVPVCLICMLISFGFYFMASEYDKEMEMASHFNGISEEQSTTLHDTITDTTLTFDEVESIETFESSAFSGQIEETNSFTENIEPKEKPEVLAQETDHSISPTKELESGSKRINAKPVRPEIKNFKTKNLEKAKKWSAKTGRYTFIKFGAEWCVSCKLMESTALVDKSVVNLLNSKFVVLDVNVDEVGGSKIKEEFYVDKLPTLIILDELGNQMSRQEGAVGTLGIIEMLESAAAYIYLEKEMEVMTYHEEEDGGQEGK